VRVSANLSINAASTLAVDRTGTKLLLSAPARSTAGGPSDLRANVEIHDLHVRPKKVTTAALAEERVDALAETPTVPRSSPPGSTTGYGKQKAANTLSLIDPDSGRVTKTVPVPAPVIAIALSPDGHRIYLTDRSSSLQVVEAATGATVATVPIGGTASGLAISNDGAHVYLAGSSGVKTVDTATHTVLATIGLPNNPSAVALTPDDKTAVVITSSDDRLVGIDLATGQPIWTVPIGGTTRQPRRHSRPGLGGWAGGKRSRIGRVPGRRGSDARPVAIGNGGYP
jgi:YVTN family beta-propeller protein